MGKKMGRKCKVSEIGVWKCGSGKGRRKWEGRVDDKVEVKVRRREIQVGWKWNCEGKR
jgi:hypothetical protein